MLQIIQAYYFLSQSRGRGYSECSQDRMIQILGSLYGVNINRRTLNRHLRKLEDSGMLRRIRRHKASPEGKILFHTTLVIIKKVGLQSLSRLALWFKKVHWKVFSPQRAEEDSYKAEFQARMVLAARERFLKAVP